MKNNTRKKQETPDAHRPFGPLTPDCASYLLHLAAIVRVINFIADHFDGFSEIVPEAARDGVLERDIAEAIRGTAASVGEYAHRVMGIPEEFTSSAYISNSSAVEGKSIYPSPNSLRQMLAAIAADQRGR